MYFLSNYAKKNVLYAFGSELRELNKNLKQDLLKVFEWFYENCTILNPDKCHYVSRKDVVSDLLHSC